MEIRSGISMEWLIINCFQVKVEFRNVGFCGGRKSGEPDENASSEASTRTSNKLNPHMVPTLGF